MRNNYKSDRKEIINIYNVDLFEKLRLDRRPLGKHQMIEEGYFMFPKLEGEIAPRMKFKGKEELTWSLSN